jgi:starvation-inducible DNA-binding protein
VDLRSQVKQACWNVKGHDFSQLHALFATMATALDAYTDLVAARLVVLGGVAWGTVCTAARQSTLPEYPGAIMHGPVHVQALVERIASYATALRADIAHATAVEDAGSAALYTEISRGVDTRLGGLEAYLHRDGVRTASARHDGRRAE